MIYVQWTATVIFLALSLLAMIGNWKIVISYVTTKKGATFIPLFGGICGCLGLLACPNPTAFKLWWLPLLVDPGSVFMVVTYLIHIIRLQFKKTNT
jgi:TRAP-type C4-dicarboxylate transport system permease small subunit